MIQFQQIIIFYTVIYHNGEVPEQVRRPKAGPPDPARRWNPADPDPDTEKFIKLCTDLLDIQSLKLNSCKYYS